MNAYSKGNHANGSKEFCPKAHLSNNYKKDKNYDKQSKKLLVIFINGPIAHVLYVHV